MSINEIKQLDEREQRLLKTLIDLYIREGQPIGSRTLSRGSDMQLSPATIRNVMADLEDMGLIHSPHTSAGRMPTEKGFRLFVDTMLNVQPLDSNEVHELKRQLDPSLNSKSLMHSATSLLSDITHLAGVIMIPRAEVNMLRQLEFLPLSNRRVLAIMVINEKEVQNRIINTERDYTESELQQAANYINTHFLGKDLSSMREVLKHELHQAQQELSELMKLVIEVSGKVLDENLDIDEELLVEGQANLMEFTDLSDMEKLRRLFEAFHKKRDILHLLDRCQDSSGVQIFIGQESGYDPLGDCSVVTAPYDASGEVLGVLGVIGPTRMAYERVIPIVDVTARLLSAALNPKD